MKKLLSFIGVFLVVSGCKAPHRLILNDNFFSHVDSSYRFRDNNVFLQTADKRYHLVKPEIKNGKIEAEIVKEPYKEKNLILFYQKKFSDVAEPIMDSAGNPTNFIRLSNKNITRIDVLNKKAKLFKRKRLYHPHPHRYILGRNLMYIGMIYLALGFIVIFSLFTVVIVQACYIATMVYGSYDAPEVLVLRAYRDEKLAPFFFGRILIWFYYKLSPVFVYVFKNNKPVNKFVKAILDCWVARISETKMLEASSKFEV